MNDSVQQSQNVIEGLFHSGCMLPVWGRGYGGTAFRTVMISRSNQWPRILSNKNDQIFELADGYNIALE